MRKSYKIKSWNRFLTKNFVVSPELMGGSHGFYYDKAKTTIKLPNLSSVDRGKEYDAVAEVGTRRSSDNEPLNYIILKVDVEINLSEKAAFDPEVLNRNPVAYELFDEVETQQYEENSNRYEKIAKNAFEYWVSIVRWVLDDYSIGRKEIIGNESGWSTYLNEVETSKTVWIQMCMYTLPGCSVVSKANWEEIQAKLDGGDKIPIYVSLKHDAEENMSNGDYRRALVDLAVSCETFLRYTVLNTLPSSLHEDFANLIEEASISQYVNKYFKKLLKESELSEYKRISSELTSLFSKRNKLMHMGKQDGVTSENCERYLNVVNKLLSLTI